MASSTRHAGRSLASIFIKNSLYQRQLVSQQAKMLCASVSAGSDEPETSFIRSDVQEILTQITGFDLEKIFKEKPMKTAREPEYKLLTDEQLKEEYKQAIIRGRRRLQMPPFLKPRENTDVVLSEDTELDGLHENNIVFTDISHGIPERERSILVRETSGRLRLAFWEERDRILQIYYPKEGRTYTQPKMFNEESLEEVLHSGNYEYILERACVQFEPDDPEYIRVTHRTFEHISSTKKFEDLWSTRHFGPMAFYLTLSNNIENFLVDMIRRDRIADAGALVSLHHILHPKSQSATEAKENNLTEPYELTMLFATKTSTKGDEVELALQAYNDEFQNQASKQ